MTLPTKPSFASIFIPTSSLVKLPGLIPQVTVKLQGCPVFTKLSLIPLISSSADPEPPEPLIATVSPSFIIFPKSSLFITFILSPII